MLAKRLTPILNVSSFRENVAWPPTDMPRGVREMHVRHPDGHVFRIGTSLEGEE